MLERGQTVLIVGNALGAPEATLNRPGIIIDIEEEDGNLIYEVETERTPFSHVDKWTGYNRWFYISDDIQAK